MEDSLFGTKEQEASHIRGEGGMELRKILKQSTGQEEKSRSRKENKKGAGKMGK